MEKNSDWKNLLFLIGLGFVLRLFVIPLLANAYFWQSLVLIFIIFFTGVFLIRKTAKIIELTTGVLKDRTGLAGGLLQALGTAFPDMVIGVVSAILSLQAASTDVVRSINLAIIAASTTFGSNIYNIFHASWCINRQNLSDKLDKSILMFPGIKSGGWLTPLNQHKVKPPQQEIDASLTILVLLSLLTTAVALGMVLFGKVKMVPMGINGDLYKLTKGLGIIILFLSMVILYLFRKSHHKDIGIETDNEYNNKTTLRIWLDLLLAGGIILLAAESLIHAVTRFSEITGTPYVITGVITALVGCLGEMIVIHNFSVHPKGRITDAIIGVAMDNIVTTMGAAFIAILGGIFLGGEALIIIFVLILFANTTLMKEISRLGNKQ